MFTNMSALSENGGHPIVGNSELAATKPERALDLPAIVMYTMLSFSLLASRISKTFSGCLWAEPHAVPTQFHIHQACP